MPDNQTPLSDCTQAILDANTHMVFYYQEWVLESCW